jgi:hypothetical protein
VVSVRDVPVSFISPLKVGTDDFDAKELAGSVIINVSDAWMVNPKKKFRMVWDLGVMIPLLIYLMVMLPFRLAFDNEAPRFTWVYWFEFVSDMVAMADIFLNLRTGIGNLNRSFSSLFFSFLFSLCLSVSLSPCMLAVLISKFIS